MAGEIWEALAEQSVVVPGTDAAAKVLSRFTEQLTVLRRQRDEIAEHVDQLVESHPLSKVLTSMPGTGVRTAARMLVEVSGRDFATARHLAAYAGLRPSRVAPGPGSAGSGVPSAATDGSSGTK